MSDTPRTNEVMMVTFDSEKAEMLLYKHACKLERELNTANTRIQELEALLGGGERK